MKKLKRTQANIPAFGLKPLLPACKPGVCHAIASGWPLRPTSPPLYFSCTKPIIKSINNWAFSSPFKSFSPLYILWDEGEACRRRQCGECSGKKKKLKEKRRNTNSTVTLCFHTFEVKWVFNQPAFMLLSNCVYSSSELLKPGSDPQIYHLHLNTVMRTSTSDTHESVRFGLIKRSFVYRRGNNFPAWSDICDVCMVCCNWIKFLIFVVTPCYQMRLNIFRFSHITLCNFWSCRGYRKPMGMIEGFLIVTFLKCNNPWVDKNQQTPTLTDDFQIRHQKCCVYRF